MEKLHNTLKLIFILPIYLFIFGFIFFLICISKVEAVNNGVKFPFDVINNDITTTSRSNLGILGTSRGYMYNCSSASNCSVEVSEYNVDYGYIWQYNTKLTNDTNGFRWDFLTNETLYKNKLYAINTYFCANASFTPVFDSWTGINQGSEMIKSTLYYSNYKGEPNISFIAPDEAYTNCMSAYQVFKPNNNSMYYGLQVKTSSGTVQSNYAFLGYNLSVLGEVNDLSSSDIQSIVNNSVGSSTSTITNNIDEMNENITNEINEMTEEQKQNTQDIIDNQNKNNDEMKDTINDNLNSCRPSNQLVDFSNLKLSNATFTFENDTLTIYSNGSYSSVYYNLLDIIKNNPGKTINFSYTSADFSNYTSTNTLIAQLRITNNDVVSWVPIARKSGNNSLYLSSYTIPTDVSKITGANIYFYGNNSNVVITDSSNSIVKPFVYFSDNSSTYEAFGEEICKNKLDEAEDTRKGILQTIRDLPQTLVNLFINMLKSLFIPTEEDLNDIIEESTNVTENFGFVGQAYTLVIDLFSTFIHIQQGNACTTLPELTLKFSGILDMEDYTLWEERNVCVSDNEWFGNDTPQIAIVRTILTISLIASFISFAITQIHEILSKEDTKS